MHVSEHADSWIHAPLRVSPIFHDIQVRIMNFADVFS